MSIKSRTKKKKNKTPFELDSFYVMDDCKVYRRRDDKEQNTKVSFLFPRVLTERMDEVAVNIGVSRSQLLRKSTKEYLHFLENQYQRNNTQMV